MTRSAAGAAADLVPAEAGVADPEVERHRRLAEAADRIELGSSRERRVWRAWGRGDPVVLLHGGYGSWTHWTRNVAALARTRRVLVPDTPGFGNSDLPGVMEAATIVASLWADLDMLIGGATVDLVGFSYGGGLGGEMAGCRPARVGRLVLVGSGGLGLPYGSREELVQWRGLDLPGRWAAHRRNLQLLMLARPESADELAVSLQAANAERAKFNSKKLRGGINLPRALAGKHVPVAGIWGERDFTLGGLPIALREEVIRGLDPAAEWVVLPGMGHWVQYEAHEGFNAILTGLLDRRRPWGRAL